MKFIASGSAGKPVVLLIHGMGCTGQHSFASTVPLLEKDCRVVVVCLDGYDAPDTTFTTIREQAEKIADYVKTECGGSVHAVLGMSMGGIIALELLTRHEVRAKKLILDSGYLPPWNPAYAKFMSGVEASMFDAILKGKHERINRAMMKHFMGYCFKSTDLCSFASHETLKNSQYSCLTYKLADLDALKKTEVEYWYGEKERYMIAGMKLLKERLPEMQEICVGNYGHGEVMCEQPARYARQVLASVNSALQ